MAENERQAAEISSLTAVLESLRTMTALHWSRIAQLENDLAGAREIGERLREAAEAPRGEAAGLRQRLDVETRARSEAEWRAWGLETLAGSR